MHADDVKPADFAAILLDDARRSKLPAANETGISMTRWMRKVIVHEDGGSRNSFVWRLLPSSILHPPF
jgi:hypothetical protein